MKPLKYFFNPFCLLFLLLSWSASAQFKFSSALTTANVANIENSTSTCANQGANYVPITVSGIPAPTLSSNLNVAAIDLTFDAICGGLASENFRDFALWLKSPSGQCMQVYSGTGSNTSYDQVNSGRYVNITLRDASCLNLPNIQNNGSWKTATGVDGNYGASAPPTPFATTFDGSSSNGEWRLYYSETGITRAPCITKFDLTFAGTQVLQRLVDGETCATAIPWDGRPMCAQTTSKTGSSQMPGWVTGATPACSGTNFGSIGGQPCQWNAANDNDVWIQFNALAGGLMCLGISGLQQQLQSIVVTDANADGDNNPCTQEAKEIATCNDQNWSLVSCPSNAVYSGTQGTSFNQQHCFTAVAGKTYYLVVDGNAGQQSTFYVSGFVGPLPAILPLAPDPFISGVRKPEASDVALNGTLLKTNLDNKNYIQEISIFDALGRLHYVTKLNVTGTSQLDLSSHMKPGFNVVKVTVSGKTVSNYTFKVIR
jgi:hypothetical protein